jgi:hypothetical protein
VRDCRGRRVPGRQPPAARMNRGWRALAAGGIVIGAVLVPPTVAGALGRPCATGQTRVAIIVDRGESGPVSSACVAAKSNDNGATILATRASMLGLPQPRFNASGLLCAIDGVPANGCGDLHDGKYAYWSYFHGSGGSWSYSHIGPGGSRVSAGVVEGWRWQPAGAGNPTDPPPRAAPSTAACASPSTPPPPPTAAPPVTIAGANTPPVTAAPNGIDPTTKPGAIPRRTTTATTPTSAGSLQRNTRATTVTTAHALPSTTAPLSEREFAARATARRSSEGAPVGMIVGALLVAILGAGGVIAARRRNRRVT